MSSESIKSEEKNISSNKNKEDDFNEVNKLTINEENKSFDNSKIYELKYIKFIIKDYSSFPRTERAKLLIYIMNVPMTISDLENDFGYIICGFNFEVKDKDSFPKIFDNSLKIIINNNTDVCFYYLEYRLLFFLDLSQSMLLFDLRQKILNIQKAEKYLNYLLKSCTEYEEMIFNFKLEKIKYKPKIICTIACSLNEEEIIFIKHAFILNQENLEKHQEKITMKINSILSKYYSLKNQDNNEIEKQMHFLNKILENSLFTFNLMSSSGSRILFLLTDGNFYLPSLGKYNNILMKLNRLDISIQMIDLFYRTNIFGLTSPTFTNDIETMKYIAQFTEGNYINENDFIKLFFPSYKNNENKNHIFFYPSLYPNILNYNSNEQESKELWEKRFSDYYNEKQIHCEICNKGFQLFLCKSILIKENNLNNKIIISKKEQLTNLINNDLNIKSIGLLSNNISVEIKELFESYKLRLSLSLILESRLRESFYIKKTKNPKKIKLMIYFLPGIFLKYNLTKENDERLCEEFKVDILIKGNIYKINQMKMEMNTKNKKSDKVELLLNFIKEIYCTDKITSYFSQLTHNKNYLEKNFFKINKSYKSHVIGLSIHKWYRFFNVMMSEIFITDKTIEINNSFIQSFLESQEYALKKYKEKQEYLKNKILEFCDDFDEEMNLGIKKIPKDENVKGILSHNGFLVIKFVWIYKNLCLLYLGFFHCFLGTRDKYFQKLKEFFLKKENNKQNLLIEFNEKHLTYFLTQPKKEINIKNDLKELKFSSEKSLGNSYEKGKKYKELKHILNNINSIIKQNDSYENKEEESMFTNFASKNLINIYLKQYQKVYQLPFDSEIALRNFLEILFLQRLKIENFQILNWNKSQMILFSYLSDLNIKDYNSNIKNNHLLSKILVFYSIEIINGESKKLINTKLMFEPNENLFICNPEENNSNKSEVKSYFISIINHFEEIEKKIRESLKIKEEEEDKII